MQSYHLYVGQLEPLSLYYFFLFFYFFILKICMYKQLWLWLTSSLGFTSKNGLNALYGSGICFPSSFLKNWQTGSFLVRFPRLCRACSLWNCGHKSRIARCTSPLGCVSRVNRRLSKDSLLRPSLTGIRHKVHFYQGFISSFCTWSINNSLTRVCFIITDLII
jgi:hypothetical protein